MRQLNVKAQEQLNALFDVDHIEQTYLDLTQVLFMAIVENKNEIDEPREDAASTLQSLLKIMDQLMIVNPLTV